jgi:ribosome-associated protein
MSETNLLIKQITEGIQEKKGKQIVIADLTSISDAACDFFVICQGNSTNQVNAIVDSVKDQVKKNSRIRPYSVDGLRNAEWVAMDYAEVCVHVFLPESRNYYKLETLWADAGLTTIPDLD